MIIFKILSILTTFSLKNIDNWTDMCNQFEQWKIKNSINNHEYDWEKYYQQLVQLNLMNLPEPESIQDIP